MSYDGQKPFQTVIQAVTDFLVSENRVHDYLSFKSTDSNVAGGVKFTENGNVYHDMLDTNDFISDDYSMVGVETATMVLTRKK